MFFRVFYRLARLAQYALWWVFRPKTVGIRGIATDADGRVLLVRHTYLPGWRFPGGGVKRRETLVDAVRRELREETGILVEGSLELLGVYTSFNEFKNDTIAVFVVRQWRELGSREHDEIAETRFFDPAELPPGTTPATRARIEELLGRAPVSFRWDSEPR